MKLAMTRSIGALGMMLCICGSVIPQVRKSQPPSPDRLLVGRRTFFDFGPPFSFYEVFSVRSADRGALIERITVAPSADACTPATVETATASISETVADLLGKTNPCSIPEKELRRELKRCKRCLVFSGADVVMQVQCGDQSRRIRMDILDRDMFDPHPTTPEHTSWTMALLGRLDQALGTSVMQRPMFAVSEPQKPLPSEPDVLLEDLRQGKFDTFFDGAPDKLSELVRQAQNPPPGPSVELLSISPFRPITYTPPTYPVLAKAAHMIGQVTFTAEVTPGGGITNTRFLSGQVLLQKAVEAAAASWKFPGEATGQKIRAALEFKMNCPTIHQ